MKVAVGCVALLMCIYGGEALTCYTCVYAEVTVSGNTVTSGISACKEDFDSSAISTATCASNEDQCSKAFLDISSSATVGGVTVQSDTKSWFRGCYDSSRGDGNAGCTTELSEILTVAGMPSTGVSGSGESCACTGDNCNAAASIVAAFSLMLAALIAHLI